MVANIADWKPDQGQMHIMLDGYIAQTLTPFCTEEYLNIFMSCLDKLRGSLFVFNNQWIVARPKLVQRQRQRRVFTRSRPGNHSKARAPAAADNDHVDTIYEIFDRKADLQMGTIVPQPSAIGVSKKTGMQCPIFFIQRNGTLGIPYGYPYPRYTLHNATELAPTILKRRNQNVRIRLQWPGYKQLQYEFRILDRRLGRQVPITMSRLVERVIRGIHRLFLEGKRDPDTFPYNERWKLGDDGIQANELTIIGLIHISKGIWVPILQLARHIMPRLDWEYIQPEPEEESEAEDDDERSKEGCN